MLLGTGTGSHTLHYLLEDAFAEAGGPCSPTPSCAEVQGHLSFAGSPLYAVLHESIYGQRRSAGATGWAAQRVRAEFPAVRRRRARWRRRARAASPAR